MAKFFIIKRKYLFVGGLVILVALIGLMGSLIGNTEIVSTPEQTEPEIKIVSIDFDPQIVIRDITYGEEMFKGVQILPASHFKVSAIIQNMTENTMTNVPVVLTIQSLEDKNKQVSKEGIIPTLEPGATAKIAFENIEALGDATGKSATAGQHEMVLAIKANLEGGASQNTEARVVFNVDSSIKS
ncbi:MAG: hypothetical protein FNP40_01080 [Dehalobacter sp. 4CP]|uniref:hypothetical protein n=1 Tax=Dehalobacter sp. CP TaxID=2594474 RepID=UPI0013C7485E|nr:hypothetical protein [Dehalobacter sp.]NBJ14176.1 hypothetical protein [Dehalobacter sp. 4CP]